MPVPHAIGAVRHPNAASRRTGGACHETTSASVHALGAGSQTIGTSERTFVSLSQAFCALHQMAGALHMMARARPHWSLNRTVFARPLPRAHRLRSAFRRRPRPGRRVITARTQTSWTGPWHADYSGVQLPVVLRASYIASGARSRPPGQVTAPCSMPTCSNLAGSRSGSKTPGVVPKMSLDTST